MEWEVAGIDDERSIAAKPILFKYARSFDHECQALKRAVAVYPQTLARVGLEDCIEWDHDEDESDSDWTQVNLPPANMALTTSTTERTHEQVLGPFGFAVIRLCAEKQFTDMLAIEISNELADIAKRLQLQHFLTR